MKKIETFISSGCYVYLTQITPMQYIYQTNNKMVLLFDNYISECIIDIAS